MDRIKVFQVLIVATLTAITLRLGYWQFFSDVVSASEGISREIILPATRGEIIASDDFPLATNQEAFILYLRPNEISDDPAKVAKSLAPFFISEKFATQEGNLAQDDEKLKDDQIKSQQRQIEEKVKSKQLFWVQIARKVPEATKKEIEQLNIKGLVFERDTKRLYPESSMSAHVLGFVASDKFGDDIGYFGLEGYYNNQLKGKPGRIGQEQDPYGFPILVGRYRPLEPKKGNSLVTSVDRTIQFVVEQKLKEAVEKYGAKQGTVIVSDPSTGNILAMATYPAYNPNTFSEFSQDLYKNPSVADTYEPGSTFKLITMSAALDQSLVSPNTKCDVCTGPRQIGGFEISTWNKKYYPNSTMTEVIQHSDNIGMTYVADKLGISKFASYINKFGFGRLTDIDLQEESPGVIRADDQWRPIDLATASFGQGLAVTPIQMVQAVGAIANGGKLINPKIVKEVRTESGVEKIKKEQRQVISPETAAQITEMMVNAVEKGEAKAFKPKGYRIAGKTGTAQIPVAGHYDPDKTIASFVGFAPADKPEFVMLVRFTEPRSSIFGSETAAPTFFAIAKEIFSYLAISPDDR